MCNCCCYVCTEQEYAFNSHSDPLPTFTDIGATTAEEREIADTTFEEYREPGMCKDASKNDYTSLCDCIIEKKAFLNLWRDKHIRVISDFHEPRPLVSMLETFPRNQVHPGTANQYDLIHPSFYPFVKGLTEVKEGIERKLPAGTFQWLPAEVHVRSGCETVQCVLHRKATFASPINGLDESSENNRRIIGELEVILSKMLPYFDKLLSNVWNMKPFRGEAETHSYRARKYSPLKFKNLQVIVKLQELYLTPENPTFSEGSWHLEGTLDDHIIGTGIFYYGMENIKDSFLNFRISVDEISLNYPQNCSLHVTHHCFLSGEADSSERIGTIELDPTYVKEGQALFFPNFIQHRVSEIALKDPTKPGHRKIAVFWLVNPRDPTISTNDVHPLQTTVSPEEAKQICEMLMLERKKFVDESNEVLEREVSLCEH